MAGNPKITVLFEKLRGQTFEITKDEVSIGRKEDCDIRLADGSVSGHHARIIRSEVDGRDVYTIYDNDSTNGTRINNIPVTEQVLKNADLITFGFVETLFDGIPSENKGPSDFSQMTHTIDIINTGDGNTGTTQTLVNFNPMAEQERKKQEIANNAIKILLMIGAVVLVAIIVWVFVL